MNDITQSILTLPHGTPIEGGFFGGNIAIDGKHYAIIVAPKAEGQSGGIWIPRNKDDASDCRRDSPPLPALLPEGWIVGTGARLRHNARRCACRDSRRDMARLNPLENT